jgi:hypothetical protein
MARLQVRRGGHICGIPVANLSSTLHVTMTGKKTSVDQRLVTSVATLTHVGGVAMTYRVPVAMIPPSAPAL